MTHPNTADNPAGSLIIGEISLFCQPALPGVSRCVAPIPGSMNRSRTWKGGHDGMEPTSGALSTRGACSGASGSLPANSRFLAFAPGRGGPQRSLMRPGRSFGSVGSLGSLPGSRNRPTPDHWDTLDPGLGRPGGSDLGP